MTSSDFILDLTNNLSISGGDLVIGQSDDQNIEAILLAEKGQFYEYPLLGYGITRKLYGPFNKQDEKKLIREALKRDDYDTITLIISDNAEVVVDAIKIK